MEQRNRNTQNFFDTLWTKGEFLKHILRYLYWNKYNQINTCHLDVQKHVSYKTGISSMKNSNTSWKMGEKF